MVFNFWNILVGSHHILAWEVVSKWSIIWDKYSRQWCFSSFVAVFSFSLISNFGAQRAQWWLHIWSLHVWVVLQRLVWLGYWLLVQILFLCGALKWLGGINTSKKKSNVTFETADAKSKTIGYANRCFCRKNQKLLSQIIQMALLPVGHPFVGHIQDKTNVASRPFQMIHIELVLIFAFVC